MCDLVTEGKGSSVRGSVIISGNADPSTISAFAIGMAGKRFVHLKRNLAECSLKCNFEANA